MTDYVMVPKALITHAQEMREDGEPTDWDSCLRDIIESAKPVSAEPVCFAHPEGLQNLKEKSEAIIAYKHPDNGCTEPLFRSPHPSQPWVKCSERMPEKFTEVLVCRDHGIKIPRLCTYDGVRFESKEIDFNTFGFLEYKNATHWMPLPKPPEQES